MSTDTSFGRGAFGDGPFGGLYLWLPDGPDPLTTHRVESWRVDLLDANDVNLGALQGCTGGSIEQKVAAVIRGGGTLDVVDVGQDIDWLSARVQPWWTVGDLSWPLGVFLLSAPVAEHDETGRSWRVELLDKLAVLDQDKVDGSYSLPAGTVVTDAVAALITGAGETALAITESAETLTSGMVWEAGTSRLRICNDLLAAINYFALWCDGYGRYVAAPYIRPQDRPSAWDFAAGPRAVHTGRFTRDEDLAAIPNKVVLVSSAGVDDEALVSVATNTDPASPFSEPSRGRWITHTETGVEATSQAVLDALAARRLTELSSVTATLTVEHAALPLNLNDAVEFDTGGVRTRAVIQSTTQALAVGALTRATMREVQA